MFSQRNNPYCELLQNCETNISIMFLLYNAVSRKEMLKKINMFNFY